MPTTRRRIKRPTTTVLTAEEAIELNTLLAEQLGRQPLTAETALGLVPDLSRRN
jgi:hypothetical protein